MPPGQSSDFATVIWVSLALVGLCIGGFYAIATLRRRLRSSDDTATEASGGFTLDDLRALLAEGKMTQEEFDRAKHQIVAAMKARQARDVLQRQEQQERARVRGGTDPRPSPPASRAGSVHHDRPPQPPPPRDPPPSAE